MVGVIRLWNHGRREFGQIKPLMVRHITKVMFGRPIQHGFVKWRVETHQWAAVNKFEKSKQRFARIVAATGRMEVHRAADIGLVNTPVFVNLTIGYLFPL